MASIGSPNYLSHLSNNHKIAKDDINKQFKVLRDNLAEKEITTIGQMDEAFKQNVASIKELIELRTETERPKEKFSKIIGKSNILNSFSNGLKELDSLLENITSQIESLTTIRYSWEIPANLFDDLVSFEGKEPELKIAIDVAKGQETYELSGNLSAMKIHDDKIYITDKEAKAIKVFARDGQYIDSVSGMITPGSMTILKNYIYVLSDQNTRKYKKEFGDDIYLYKISIGNLEIVSTVTLVDCSYGVIDTDGENLFSLSVLQDSSIVLGKWKTCLSIEGLSYLTTPHLFSPNTGRNKKRYELNNKLVPFYDIKIGNKEIFVLFSISVYCLQSFDFEGNIIRVILEEDLAHNIVGLCLLPQKNGEIVLRDETNSQILVFSYQGQITRTIGTEDTSKGMKSPMCMDVDKRGNLVVCDGKANWVMQDIPM